jgi:hypothetical protein
MTQPIGGYSRTAYDPTAQDETPATNAGLDFCRNANSVTEGFLCDEPTVVSNACRSPTNDVDKYVCNDKNLADVQSSLWDATKEVVKVAAQLLLGRLP